MHRLYLLICIAFFLANRLDAQSNQWGLIANEDFRYDTVKSTVFFTGNWRNGIQFYDFNPSDNRGAYTLHPADARHLGWSENEVNRNFAIKTMVDAGINIINFSYWGLPGTDNWALWAPMQTSSQSHNELFTAVLNKNVLVAPFIESFAATDDYPGFSFMDDFPGSNSNPSPQLRVLIEDLIDRYLLHPINEHWPEKWARVYDQEGQKRYLVSIIHVASNTIGITDQEFASGFDQLANAIFEDTGIKIGFALDILPPDNFAPGTFKATANNTGDLLADQNSLLAIQCFLPEIWEGESNENQLIQWKAAFAQSWINTGIPYIHGISSGYDAHILFPNSPVYGNNKHWRYIQDSLAQKLKTYGLSINGWNGYTEGFVGVPTLQHSDTTYNWICKILGGNKQEEPVLSLVRNRSESHIGIGIFPNPAKEFITLNNEFGNVQIRDVTIYDACFTPLFNFIINRQARNSTINIGNYPDGIYWLRIQTETSIFFKNIIVVH